MNSLLGITRVKRQFKKALGINAVLAPFRAPGNLVRRVKRRSGYYAINRLLNGRVPLPLGLPVPSFRSSGVRVTGGILGLVGLWFLAVTLSALGKALPGGPAVTPQRRPEGVAAVPVRYKNGRRLTAQQIAEQDAYVQRAQAKREAKRREELEKEAELRRVISALAVADQQWRARQQSEPQTTEPAPLSAPVTDTALVPSAVPPMPNGISPSEPPTGVQPSHDYLAPETVFTPPPPPAPSPETWVDPAPFSGSASPYQSAPNGFGRPLPTYSPPSSTSGQRVYRNERGLTYTYPSRSRRRRY